ncbi:MAG: DUF1573 domain-containing protein [Bacteroidales bacterium]
MKNLLISTILVFFFSSFLSYSSDEKSELRLIYDGMELRFMDGENFIDFGQIKHDHNVSVRIKVENQSAKVLQITNVRSSCGISLPAWPRDPLLPGDFALIQLKYDSSRLGSFTRNITIHANTTDSRTVIELRGEIIP